MKTSFFSVSGLNQLKLINTLRKEGISVYKLVRISQKEMTFRVPYKNERKASEILDRQGFCYKVESVGYSDMAKRVLRRIGLVVGAAMMLVLGLIASTHIWRIEVSGNERIDELTIIRALKENGISVGQKKRFDRKSVEDIILSLSDVSAVSAQIVGTTLKVEIVESAVVTPPKLPGDIVSLYDAEVTRIVVQSGTAKVRIGDRVPIGTVLIEGVEYDTDGNPIANVNPSGKVYGKVNFTYSEVASIGGKFVRTGKHIRSTTLSLFGWKIGKVRPPEGMYESKKTSHRIGSFFPFYAETTDYYELVEVKTTLEELLESVKDKAVGSLIIRAGGSPAKVTTTTRKISEEVYRITVHIEAEVSIGGKQID